MSKHLNKCCQGSFQTPAKRTSVQPNVLRVTNDGFCPRCKRWVGLTSEGMLTSHYPVKPE